MLDSGIASDIIGDVTLTFEEELPPPPPFEERSRELSWSSSKAIAGVKRAPLR